MQTWLEQQGTLETGQQQNSCSSPLASIIRCWLPALAAENKQGSSSDSASSLASNVVRKTLGPARPQATD
jgi:hypothetical protein